MKIAAGVLLKQGDKYLLVQEKRTTAYGLWHIPAGRVHGGESILHAARREAEEETGFRLQIGRKLNVFTLNNNGVRVHVFEAKIIGGSLKLDSGELLDIGWFTSEEIKDLPLRRSYIRTLVGLDEIA